MKNRLLLLLLFCCITIYNGIAQTPSLVIKGDNFSIESLETGKYPFSNRTNMTLGNIPNEYEGWEYTKINANSSWQSGPLPAVQIKPDGDGFIYAMVEDQEKPTVCAQWASDNGWELVSSLAIPFGTNVNQTFSIYKKSCVVNNWVNIVQPETFSGALIIAPSISEAVVQTIDAAKVSISASGWLETSVLDNGTIAYANRSYVFSSVDDQIKGLYFTRYNGGGVPKLQITVEEAGDVYIAVSGEDASYDPIANGWTEVSDIEFQYNDPNNTTFTVYKKAFALGDKFSINATGWQGVLILSSETIEYTLLQNFTPPPGVVIHNSKASSQIYIGSPSIVVLADGTYLASHDYFGTTTESFIYKSTDKGETWERIAEIMYLKWSTIFRRGNEVYLIGVNVNESEYGNTVILKSLDDGVTWTSPTNSTSGLLRSGYYHCAPVPVVKYNGRYWRAMEDRGEANGSWGNFKAFMMSVDENADLLDASNWTFSNELTFDAGPNGYGNAWLEGNAVIAKDGTVKDVLRVNYASDDIAAIVDVSADGKTASFNSENGFVSLPGALKKFTIRYDTISGKYWTLSNYVLPADRGGNLERTRNTIALSCSSDLKNWTIKEILLHVDEIAHHGFQYLDWLIEGNDIIAVSRTAWDDETGQANNQHNANYITFHRFKNFRYEKGSSTMGVTATRWYNNAKSAMALTFDDGFEAHYTYAYPILKEYNIPATFFVNSGNMVHKGETQVGRYGFWEDFKEIADNGYEIGSHSLTHANLTTATFDVLENELQQDKNNIEQNIGKPCLTHAYPYCLNNTDVQEEASQLFIGARQCGNLENNASLSKSECYTINSDLLTWIAPRSLSNDSESFLELKSSIENTVRHNRNFGVLCIHEVLPFNLLSTSDTYEIATTEWLTEMCEYLAEKKASGDIWSATFRDIIQYAQERDNMRLRRTDFSSDSIGYDITVQTYLDTTLFYHPLTLAVTIPDGWTSARCSVINEDGTMVSDSIYAASAGKFYVNVIPDKQKIILVNNEEVSSVKNNILKKDVLIYPNPVKDKLELKSNIPIEGICFIYNIQGVFLTTKKLNSEHLIDVSNLSSGVYVLNIFNGKNSEAYRFIKE